MARYLCRVCEYVYDETRKGTAWAELADDWLCPVCEFGKALLRCHGPARTPASQRAGPSVGAGPVSLGDLRRDHDDLESAHARHPPDR